MLDVWKRQYSFIRSTREILFEFLEQLPLEDLHAKVQGFGSGSIIKTHMHVADCYRYWLGSFALGQKRADFSFTTDDEIEHANVEQVRERFSQANDDVNRFLDTFAYRWSESIENEVKWQKEPWSTTPLWLLTHTETHEFHHKGQIVSMTRHLGYEPPNTDLD